MISGVIQVKKFVFQSELYLLGDNTLQKVYFIASDEKFKFSVFLSFPSMRWSEGQHYDM